jgi:hypothetical protein
MSANYTLQRFLPGGAPDRGFGGDSVVEVLCMLPGNYSEGVGMLTTQSDDRILVITSGGHDFLGRVGTFTVDGALDRSFGFRGRARLPSTPRPTSLGAVALAPGGRILAAGSTWSRADKPLNLVVTRYLEL